MYILKYQLTKIIMCKNVWSYNNDMEPANRFEKNMDLKKNPAK